jgi:hypothetical protein
MEDSGWELDGVTLHVQFCEGGEPWGRRYSPAAKVINLRVPTL